MLESGQLSIIDRSTNSAFYQDSSRINQDVRSKVIEAQSAA